MDPTKLKNLIYYFETLEFPPDATEEDIAYYLSRNKNKFYLTRDGLYYKNNCKVLNKHEPGLAFQQYHYHPLGGHFGAGNTYYKISEKYYWDNMQETIKSWVNSCERCQTKGRERIQEELHPIPVMKQPYHMVAMDIKHVETSRGNHKYVIVAIDFFTKYVELRSLICASSLEIMSFFVEDIICRHSVPKVLLTDNGNNFGNLLINTLCSQFCVKFRHSSVYHPQGDGLVERFMRTLGACLSKLPKDERPDWHFYLQPIAFSYNCIKQASTRHSPFYLLHGYQPNTCFDNVMNQRAIEEDEINPTGDQDQQITTAFDTIHQKLEAVRQEAYEYIQKAQKIQYDAVKKRIKSTTNQNKPKYNIGDLVLKYDDKASREHSGRIVDNFVGPYRIVESHANSTYVLQSLVDGELTKRIYVLPVLPMDSDFDLFLQDPSDIEDSEMADDGTRKDAATNPSPLKMARIKHGHARIYNDEGYSRIITNPDQKFTKNNNFEKVRIQPDISKVKTYEEAVKVMFEANPIGQKPKSIQSIINFLSPVDLPPITGASKELQKSILVINQLEKLLVHVRRHLRKTHNQFIFHQAEFLQLKSLTMKFNQLFDANFVLQFDPTTLKHLKKKALQDHKRKFLRRGPTSHKGGRM